MSRINYYDAIVIGTKVAGLIAGGLLKRQNYRVLFLGQGNPDNEYSYKGIKTPALPVMLPPYGHSPTLDDALNTLGIENPVQPIGIKQQPLLQLLTPEERIDLLPDRKDQESELKRAWPEQANQIFQLIDTLRSVDERFVETLKTRPTLPAEKLIHRSRLKKLGQTTLDQQIPDTSKWPPIMQALAEATSFISNLESKAISPTVRGHLVLAILGGIRIVPNLHQLLADALKKSGVDTQPNLVVEEILFERKHAVGVKTLRSSKTFKCNAIVADLPIDMLLELIPLKQRHRRIRLQANSIRPSRTIFTLNIALPKDCIPLGMGTCALAIQDLKAPFTEENLLWIQQLPFGDNPDKVLLNIKCLVPYKRKALGREYLAPLQKRIFECISWYIPFLESCNESVFSPFWEERDQDQVHPNPWGMHQLIETESDISFGCSVLPTTTPYKNVLYCGSGAIPGLGNEGAALSAFQVVKQINEIKKLKKVL
jgi:phytoene dehydrogenase-like protein